MQRTEEIIQHLITLLIHYGPKALLAFFTLAIGLKLISKSAKALDILFNQKDLDPTLRPFLRTLAMVVLRVLLFVSVASMIGIETTSFVAVLGAGGLALGLALQGSLAHFAGGVLILTFRPFRVGDTIDAQGFHGVIKEIDVFSTTLVTPENKHVILPNGPLAGGAIVNHSLEALHRLDLTVKTDINEDPAKVRACVEKIAQSDERILKEPKPLIAILSFADNAVIYTVRVWMKREEYWDVHFELQEKIKTEFRRLGIQFPIPTGTPLPPIAKNP